MNKAIFIDKDGTISENLYETDGVLMSPATVQQIKIIKNVKEGIADLKKQGFKIIVITNQPGLAFGYISQKNFTEICGFLKKELGVDAIYYCPHHPSRGNVKKFVKECDCRKPLPELIKKAAKEFNIDVKNSYMVGDSLSDVQTGTNAGVKKNFLLGIIREDVLAIQHQKKIYPDFTLPNLVEVAKKIRELEKI